MPLFICSQCGHIDNTATSHYWLDVLCDGKPPLCALCDPAIGQWHNRFARMLPNSSMIAEIREHTPGHPPVDDEGKYLDGHTESHNLTENSEEKTAI